MTLLLLAGTGEARRIADRLAGQVPAIATLAGVTRNARLLAIPTHSGGFGGEAGFCAFLQDRGIRAVLDATHPFAAQISQRSARLCQTLGVPYCQLLRPEWQPEDGDRWVDLADEAEAADHVPDGAVVFIATGRQTVEKYGNLAARRMICRVVDPPGCAFPYPGGTYFVARPPFTVAEEEACFSRLGVTWLIAKNAGGEAGRSKLIAARRLGICVGMVRRPAQPHAPKVETVAAAIAWALSAT
ncbi:MAG: cobalt-precorrin-6A reductase [Rhodobacterales bacterium]|nr:MAG: cobalt-precorrin-6A reductase [Rhodobacterales bacterium]